METFTLFVLLAANICDPIPPIAQSPSCHRVRLWAGLRGNTEAGQGDRRRSRCIAVANRRQGVQRNASG
jgi:hypothetical protein